MLTLNIILDQLTGYELASAPGHALLNRGFPEVTMVSIADQLSVSEGWLHIGDIEQAAAFRLKYPGAIVLCACPLSWDEGPAVDVPNCVYVRTPKSADQLFVEVRNIFRRIRDWLSEIRVIYQSNGGYAEVLRTSESIIGNFITISDSAYRLLAHTEGLTTNDPVQAMLVENGCHPPQTIKRFNELSLPEVWRTSTAFIEVVRDSPICEYPTVAHVFRYRRNYFVHIVMVCEQRPLTDAVVDLFKMLVEALMPFVRRDWDARKGFAQPHDYLFERLIRQELSSEAEIAGEATMLGMPCAGSFKLLCMSVEEADSLGLDNIAWKLVEQLPSSKVSLYQDHILLLFADGSVMGRDDIDPSFLKRLFVGELPVQIGVSQRFGKLSELGFAYRQALAALRFCEPVEAAAKGCCPDGELDRMVVSQFSDHFVDYVMHALDDDYPFLSFCLQSHPLARMVRDDSERSTREYEIFVTYLRHERRATAAANELHMHRNNVLYHVERICDRYGLDLDNPDVRFEALLVARLLDMLQS